MPVEQRRNYSNVFNAFTRIAREEGFFNLWKGCQPTVVRAMALNLGMLVSYEEAKERLEKYMSRQMAWFFASVISGAIASTMSLPFDNVKTKL